MSEPAPSKAVWMRRGFLAIFSVPALLLCLSMIGFGVFARESGMTLMQTTFLTGVVWALPSQVLLVGAIAKGSSIATAAIAVSLSAVRLVPMTASWVPMVRGPRTSKWHLILFSHFVAVTAWVVAAMRLPAVPVEARMAFFGTFAVALCSLATLVTALSHFAAGTFPPILAGVLFFVTPVYFLTALTASARIPAERLALATGLLLGPLLRFLDVPLDLVWGGLIGGTAAFFIPRMRRRG